MPPPGELPKMAFLAIGAGNRRDNFAGSASSGKVNRHDFGRFAEIGPFFLKSPLAIIRRCIAFPHRLCPEMQTGDTM